MAYDKLIEGQCGTCVFAEEFDFGPSPSEGTDGVHCTSSAHAKFLDDAGGGTTNQDQLQEYGFMDLFRLEFLAEESFRCPQWQKWDTVI